MGKNRQKRLKDSNDRKKLPKPSMHARGMVDRGAQRRTLGYAKGEETRGHIMHEYHLRTSCLDRFCIACNEFANLKIHQSSPPQSPSFLTTDRLPLSQYAIWRARSHRCTAAFFLHLRMAASMIYSIPNFHRIHPHKILGLVIPYHIELLLTNRTWLVGKRWVRRYWDVLVLGIRSGQRCSKCSSRCIRGGIREWRILSVVA